MFVLLTYHLSLFVYTGIKTQQYFPSKEKSGLKRHLQTFFVVFKQNANKI